MDNFNESIDLMDIDIDNLEQLVIFFIMFLSNFQKFSSNQKIFIFLQISIQFFSIFI